MLGHLAEVLGGGGKEELVHGAVRASEAQTIELQDALEVDEVTKVVSALRGVLLELVGAAGGPAALAERCEAALVKAKLKPAMIRDTFMKPFGKAKAKPK